MKIDITPIIEEADKWHRVVLDTRELEALYVVRLANGEDYSVEFDKKGLELFQPNKTVSEMIKSWEESFIRRHGVIVEALRTNLHPTFTIERKEMISTPSGFEYPTGRVFTEPKPLDNYDKERLNWEKNKLEKQFGNMVFVKIV
jgi:hypothetical protein